MKGNERHRLLKMALMLGLMTCFIALSGCSGCVPTSAEKLSREELEKRQREQRDAVEKVTDQVTLPTDSETVQMTAKPGHWHETQQQFKSNREDLQVIAVGSITRGTAPALIPGTNTLNDYSRRTSLPKGQTKTIDLQSFVPVSASKTDDDPFAAVSSRLNFQTELLSWPLMTSIRREATPANELKPHEFQLFVISPQALSYEYLTVLDAVYWRKDEGLTEDRRTQSYKVSLVKPKENRYAIPRSMLTMTAVAVIIWDDVSADDLSADQQTALIDWLHWGGQLLVSGPSSWSRLQNSFLAPYLPATSAEATEFTSAEFESLSNHWLTEDVSERKSSDPLEIVGPPVAGLRFSLNDRGQWLPHSGELVAESQVGRGRVVLTAFPMREPRIYRWKYYGSFFSSGLLRRYPRTVIRTADERLLAQVWDKPFGSALWDPRLHSNFRILSRDLPLSNRPASALGLSARDTSSAENTTIVNGASVAEATVLAMAQEPNRSFSLAPDSPREELRWGAGGGAWNDFSGLSYQAIVALKAAAGIELPSRKTIVYLLGGYLLCLVPLNWLVFRSIRRLEFAWVAAPIMALIGVVVVTKVASLDIGFARRTTEVSLLELHGNHPRGHLTKFLALYTSLSTNYAVEFAENDSVALPLGDFGRTQMRAAASVKNMRTAYGRSEGVRLEPVTVYSNSTEMLHAEQIITLPGSLSLGGTSASSDAIRNQTGLNLKAVLAVRCVAEGRIEMGWIGELADGQIAAVQFETTDLKNPVPQWSKDLSTQPNLPSPSSDVQVDTLWVGGILQEVLVKTPLVVGQTRLIGYTDDRPGKLEVFPVSDQFDGRCVVVAHLTPQTLGDILPDKRILSKIASAFQQPANMDDLQVSPEADETDNTQETDNTEYSDTQNNDTEPAGAGGANGIDAAGNRDLSESAGSDPALP